MIKKVPKMRRKDREKCFGCANSKFFRRKDRVSIFLDVMII
jgi:hypothetical protein